MWGFHVLGMSHDRVRVCLFAGSHIDDVPRLPTEATDYVPCWLVPISSFGTVLLTTFISSSRSLPIPVSLAPPPHRYSEFPRMISRSDRTLRGTSSGKLHTPLLPATHVSLGYCWSYNRFPPDLLVGGTMTHRAHRSVSTEAITIAVIAGRKNP